MQNAMKLTSQAEVVEAAQFNRDYAMLPQELADKLHQCNDHNRKSAFEMNSEILLNFVLETLGEVPAATSLPDLEITDPIDPHAPATAQM